MEQVFKITARRQLEYIRPLISITIIFYLILKGFEYVVGTNDLGWGLLGLVIWYLVLNFIPHIILHLRYYFINKDYIFIYHSPEKRITIKNKIEESTFIFDDIKFVEYYKTGPLLGNRMKWLPFDGYYYFIIYLKNGEQFVITSLLAGNIELPISENKREANKVIFWAFPISKSRFSVSKNKTHL